ncbi:hypothetical protein LO80_06160 [Candidatus Francisella endociliophora]|uniref:Phosphatidylinositol diacylglycerol-lyase n=1 Tax=Candidatus Francisella endociliophora TaxID=653937 RepID=A0A097EPU2_9GAMM|nr:hypothetical protein [Francisella sp. FSC1006]AIT09585.1 hypothetical protein LO80_06160 [Francisella sp. FSC1006]
MGLELNMQQSQSFIAHQVNYTTELPYLINKNIGLEIDIAFSNTKKDWVIAHHDYDDLQHSSLESWFKSLIKALKGAKSSKLLIWLDIKTADADLLKLVEITNKHIPSNITLIYDLGQPVNILDKKYHKLLKPFLRENDGIGTWITKDQLSDVSPLAKELDKNHITNSIISYGEVVEICTQTVQDLCELNATINNGFKKVFTWNVEFNNEIEYFSQQKYLDGQIIGYKKAPWDKDCHTKLELFENLNQNSLAANFWL